MKILNQFPPNIQEIRQRFNLNNFTPIFTYGDTIYNPLKQSLTDDLIAHEEIHQKQQENYKPDFILKYNERIGLWWKDYLEDNGFRLSQEIEAYKRQYEVIKASNNREFRRFKLNELATFLSSELYGNIISKNKAKELIDV